MARLSIISILFVLLISSCAQVGVISGGEKDEHAPKIIDDKTAPPSNTTFFKAAQVSITFDEYFKLANPAENIFMVPPHAKVQAKVRKKTLLLNWSDSLKPNTTYSIYLNGAVKDITAGNDSVYQYVFSTGSVIDSLSYTTSLRDAGTDAPLKNHLILLSDMNGELFSMARSDQAGLVNVKNLPSGTYRVLALNDENKNMKVDQGEQLGFPQDSILQLDSSLVDKNGIRVFQPAPKKGIRLSSYTHPIIRLGIEGDLKQAKILLNGSSFPSDRMHQVGEDSLLLFPLDSLSGTIKLQLTTVDFEDSVKIRIPLAKEPIEALEIKQSNGVLNPFDTLTIFANSWIVSTDPSAIRIRSLPDSAAIDFSLRQQANELHVLFDQSKLTSMVFSVDSGALITEWGRLSPVEKVFQLKKNEDFGVVLVDLSAYSDPLVLKLFRSGRSYRTQIIENPKELLELSNLEPGDFTFQVVLDVNRNGKWDTGSIESFQQPEKIDSYSTPLKVRANWEIEVPLVPKPVLDE